MFASNTSADMRMHRLFEMTILVCINITFS